MIVDASAFIASFVVAGAEDMLVGDPILAPDLIVPEVLNAAWKLRRAGLNAPESAVIMRLLERLVIVPSLPYAKRAAEIAQRLDHPVYDCLYLAIADITDDVLVTADQRLVAKIAKDPLRKRVTVISI